MDKLLFCYSSYTASEPWVFYSNRPLPSTSLTDFSHAFKFSFSYCNSPPSHLLLLSPQAPACKTSPSLQAIVCSPFPAFHTELEVCVFPPSCSSGSSRAPIPVPHTIALGDGGCCFSSLVNSDLYIYITAVKTSNICNYCHIELSSNFFFLKNPRYSSSFGPSYLLGHVIF